MPGQIEGNEQDRCSVHFHEPTLCQSLQTAQTDFLDKAQEAVSSGVNHMDVALTPILERTVPA